MKNATAVIAALALVAAFWWQGERFIAANGPTFDEGAHLASGYAYWAAGDFRINPEHPPLFKLLWAAPLALDGGPPFPHEAASTRDHWKLAHALLYESGVPAAALLAPARRVNLAVGCGVVLLAGWWAFRLWRSRLAGLAAVAFAAADPTLQSLSCVLSTDVGLTFFALLTTYLLWEYAAAPTRPLLIACGVSLGLMLGSKFSAVAVAAGLGAAGLAHVLRGGVLALPGTVEPPGGWATGARVRAAVDLAFRLGIVAAVALAATYGFVNFGQWGAGLKFQLTRGEHGDGACYLLGEVSRAGWLHYFAVAAGVKLPLGLLAAAAAGLVFLVGSKPNRLAWLLVPPAVFVAAASYSRVDIGVRVVLPAVPFLYVIAARLAAPACCCFVRYPLLAGCLAWAAFAGWNAAPHQLAYFNEVARGPVGGLKYVADSNVDWGQGLPQLKAYMDRERIDVVYLSYFGTDRPEAHGIRFSPLPGYGRIGPPGGEAIPADAPRHVVAISANNLVGIHLPDPDTFAWLRARQPTAVLAGSIIVYDLTGDPGAVDRLRR
jgi:hypothetical protein